MKISQVPSARVTTGTYAGDGTVNKAIPHGLGVTPAIVMIHVNLGSYWFRIIKGHAVITALSASVNTYKAVTKPDNTNFYVGNSGDYAASANSGTGTYWWAAIG